MVSDEQQHFKERDFADMERKIKIESRLDHIDLFEGRGNLTTDQVLDDVQLSSVS